MKLDLFLLQLKNKFNYNEKVITAIEKVIPKIISYYGSKYINIIEKALSDCCIVLCSSKETINMIKLNKKVIDINKDNALINENIATGGVYYSFPIIVYDMNLNSYIIKSIERCIIISHTYNLDSARGLAILTHNICHLIKSYEKEYELHGNILIKRCGLEFERYFINTSDVGISINLIDSRNVGLNEGISSYDEEEILKLVLNDNYETFDYQNTKYIALCLKDRLKLKSVIDDAELSGDISIFMERYGVEEFEKLSNLADQSCLLEDKKNNYNITKDEIININKEMKYLISFLEDNMVNYLVNKY